MDTVADNTPSGWLEIIEESEADLAAGRILSGEAVHRELHESIARLEARPVMRRRKQTNHR